MNFVLVCLIQPNETFLSNENRKSGRLKSKNGYALLCVSLVLIDRKQLKNFFLCIKKHDFGMR